jgi:hypothetical protein
VTAIADRLEGVLERLEAALAVREAENRRLKRVEAAATSALSDLDALLGSADAEALAKPADTLGQDDDEHAAPLRSAERG